MDALNINVMEFIKVNSEIEFNFQNNLFSSKQGLFESFEEIADEYEVQKIIKQNRAICYQIEGN